MTMRPEDIKLLRDAAYWVGRRPADDRYTEVARISRSLDELADRLDASNAKCAATCVIHHVRHAGATAADAAGVRPGALSTVLGHSDSRSTARYIHREGVESAHHVAEKMERRPPRRTKK